MNNFKVDGLKTNEIVFVYFICSWKKQFKASRKKWRTLFVRETTLINKSKIYAKVRVVTVFGWT